MIYSVIVFILLETIISLVLFSTRTATRSLFTLGEEAIFNMHNTMLNSLQALNNESIGALKSSLSLLEYEMMVGETLYLDEQTTRVGDFTLPIMRKGNKDISTDTYFVDSITEKLGAAATIFQLVDNKLLRISTSVVKKDGNRATGLHRTRESSV